MSTCPKRHCLLVSEAWPLKTPLLPPLELPMLTLSPSSSNESLDQMAPSTPTTGCPAVPLMPPSSGIDLDSLPGFHFSTTNDNVDPVEFHRMAAQLLSGESSRRDSAIAGDVTERTQIRRLQYDLGKDSSGRYSCSCGKVFLTAFRLRDHVATCAGILQHPCPTCDRLFETKNKLDRHVATAHNCNREACPECGDVFPISYLPKHLVSGPGGCDGIMEVASDPAPEIDLAYRSSSHVSASQRFWIYDGDLSWHQRRGQEDALMLRREVDDATEQTMTIVKELLQRPVSQQSHGACDLCGEWFSGDGDALARHIGEHSLDFAEKRQRCDECRVYFANEKDLDRHLQSAKVNQHCGFTFRHSSGACKGHHPPPYYRSSSPSDHNLMQKHLWAWERGQLRSHRVTVARILAEQLSPPTTRHMSIHDCKRTYAAMLPHVRIANGDQSQSETDWTSNGLDSEGTQLDAYFGRLISETFPREDMNAAKEPYDASGAFELRPDFHNTPKDFTRESKRISKRRSIVDMARRVTAAAESLKQDHKRTHSSPISFLRHQASRESNRPRSLPVVAAGSLTIRSTA